MHILLFLPTTEKQISIQNWWRKFFQHAPKSTSKSRTYNALFFKWTVLQPARLHVDVRTKGEHQSRSKSSRLRQCDTFCGWYRTTGHRNCCHHPRPLNEPGPGNRPRSNYHHHLTAAARPGGVRQRAIRCGGKRSGRVSGTRRRSKRRRRGSPENAPGAGGGSGRQHGPTGALFSRGGPQGKTDHNT